MKVLLTGGTGFIGSHVAVELLERGHELTILALDPDKVPALAARKGVTMLGGTITDQDLIAKAVAGQHAVVHIALNYTRRIGWEVLVDDTLPTVYLSDVAAAADVDRFIYTSSTAVNDSLYSGAADLPEPITMVTCTTKQRPATFYGATKAASENYLMAQSHLSDMRVNFIRPGYTFGNPAVEGGSIQSDTRFADICRKAAKGEEITVIEHDGTQFISAPQLARLYGALLDSDQNRKQYFGLGWRFITWASIAHEAVRQAGTDSPVALERKGYSEDGLAWNVSDMEIDFGFTFDGWDEIPAHISYLLAREGSQT